MAIKKDGSLWVWGCNKYGQLGNGKTKGSRTPICIMNLVFANDSNPLLFARWYILCVSYNLPAINLTKYNR
ncbi:MAG: RCC1 domain-containing protein [Defluviitaleaceae bacterium]|nr:RCC1 domain-containing protein [Defluviitaleaceae bacterium]